MRNHFHLAVETPKGNLVAGMQWLQATFANRFNRLRGERGHLFQGRYKALLVEPGAALGQLCHYIHLNPVRVGIVSIGQLKDYRDSSYWHLWHRAETPHCLCLETALRQAGGLEDTLAGRRAYEKFLTWQAAHGPVGRNQAYVSMSRGWVLGSQGFKEELLKQHAPAPTSRAWETTGKAEIQRLLWAQTLAACFHVLGQSPTSAAKDRKSAPWKIATAAYLKQTTQANNGWLAEQLYMGTASSVSHHISAFSQKPGPAKAFFATLIAKFAT
jgi:hypothetical protein